MRSLLACIFVTLSCIATTVVSFAYSPFYGKKTLKTTGLLKTLSGIFFTNGSPINMVCILVDVSYFGC